MVSQYHAMDADPENLALVRRLDARLDGLSLDVCELKDRTSAVDLGLTAVRRDIAALAETDARLQMSVDRMRDDVSRIQRRLDIVDEPAA